MLFSSITFLYLFLPCVIFLYFLVGNRFKNGILLVFSLIFYAWGEPKLIILMIVEIVLGYVFGLLIARLSDTAGAKICLIASVGIDIALLGYFKYIDFFLSVFRDVTSIPIKEFHTVLPIGISFYTFQLISYSIDVYRKEVLVQKNPLLLATYISMFPQLIAGPIVRYCDVEKQLKERTHSFARAAAGTRRFMLGLGKKVLIANAFGELCGQFRLSAKPSVLYFWIYAVAFTLHIYFDFSGYSDMAIGLGKIFGFDFPENFQYPYISKSITEFWRRWHISLGTWFRDYVYIPLGGNRVKKWTWLRNIAVVWFLTGFWHGAAWNFILWGLYFAVFLILEKSFLGEKLKKAKVTNHIYVIFFVIISFVIFNAGSLTEAAGDIGAMFGLRALPFSSKEAVYALRNYGFLFAIAILGTTPGPKIAYKILSDSKMGKSVRFLEPVFLFLILIVVTSYLVDGSFNPFLYFRF